MASLFKKGDSPYWQLRYRDENGVWRKRSLKFRVGRGTETADARRTCAEQTAAELGGTRAGEAALWKNWIQAWIDSHFSNELSRVRAVNAWTHLGAWLAAQGLLTPAAMRYEQATLYFQSRVKAGAAHNTALVETKFMSSILQEAVRRRFIVANPWVKMGLKRVRGKEKPEISEAEARRVEAELVARDMPGWMRESWKIATLQGCRISECHILMSDVDVDRGVLYFRNTKGDRPFATLLHPDLVALASAKRAEKEKFLCELPRSAAKLWWIFLRKKLKLPFSFHSTRVTVATQLARGKVDRTEAMRFLNHSSELVHRTYQRLRPDDLSAAVAAVGFSGHTGDRPGNPGAQPASTAHGSGS